MEYTSRGLKRRRNTDKWEVTLSHRDSLSGEQVPSYHTVEAKTRKGAERARNELIRKLERQGSACTSKTALGKVDEAFDIDLEGIFKEPKPPALTLEFTAEQPRAMLAEAERREAANV